MAAELFSKETSIKQLLINLQWEHYFGKHRTVGSEDTLLINFFNWGRFIYCVPKELYPSFMVYMLNFCKWNISFCLSIFYLLRVKPPFQFTCVTCIYFHGEVPIELEFPAFATLSHQTVSFYIEDLLSKSEVNALVSFITFSYLFTLPRTTRACFLFLHYLKKFYMFMYFIYINIPLTKNKRSYLIYSQYTKPFISLALKRL